MSDQSGASGNVRIAGKPAQTQTATSTPPKPYVPSVDDIVSYSNIEGIPDSKPYSPSVGDVVEFEYEGKTFQGVIFRHDVDSGDTYSIGGPRKVRSYASEVCDVSNIRITSYIQGMEKATDYSEAESLSKAYFAQASKPGFEVGDAVIVTECSCSLEVGDEAVVEEVRSDGQCKLRGSGTYYPDWIKLAPAPPTFTPDPDKSYAENQAAWIEFYGLKVGSKVKVVRKFEDREDGYDGTSRDSVVGKAGKISIDAARGGLFVSGEVNTFIPYFALEPA